MPFRNETKWVHRVWLTPEDQPEDYQFIGQLWEELNPSWRVVNWNAHALEEFGIYAVPTSFDVSPDKLRDLVGLALVHKYGGIYASHGLEPIEPLNEVPVFAAWMTHCGYLGSRNPEDPVWGLLLDLIRHSGREIKDMSLTDFYLLYGGEDLLRMDVTPRARMSTEGYLVEDHFQ